MTPKPGLFGRIFKRGATNSAEESANVPHKRQEQLRSKSLPKNKGQSHALHATELEPFRARSQSGREIDLTKLETTKRQSVCYRNYGAQASPRRQYGVGTISPHGRQRAASAVSSSASPAQARPRLSARRFVHSNPGNPTATLFQSRPPPTSAMAGNHKIIHQTNNRGGAGSSGSDEEEAMTPALAYGNATPLSHKTTTAEIRSRRHSMGVYLPRHNSNSMSTTAIETSPSSLAAQHGRHEGRSPSNTPQTNGATTKGEGITRGGQVTQLSKKECKLIVSLMKEPRNKKRRNRYVRYLIKKERLREAENIFESGLLLHKQDWQLHFQFGVFCYDFLNKPHKAELYLTTALQLNQSASCIHTHLGILVRRRGNDALAEDHFVDALNLNALDFLALGELVAILRDDNRYEMAYQYLTSTYERLDPNLDPSQIDMVSFQQVLQLAQDISSKISVASPVPEYARNY